MSKNGFEKVRSIGTESYCSLFTEVHARVTRAQLFYGDANKALSVLPLKVRSCQVVQSTRANMLE